jgi:hypothetical protein
MWPALNFAADSLENFSTSPPSAVNLKFSLPTAHCLLAAHGRRKREPSDTGLKGDTFRELTSTEALRPSIRLFVGRPWLISRLRVADLLN